MRNPLTDPQENNLTTAELEVEKVLRPHDFKEFAGQQKIVDNLKVFIEAAKQRGDSLDHTLLHGPPGLGQNNARSHHCK